MGHQVEPKARGTPSMYEGGGSDTKHDRITLLQAGGLNKRSCNVKVSRVLVVFKTHLLIVFADSLKSLTP